MLIVDPTNENHALIDGEYGVAVRALSLDGQPIIGYTTGPVIDTGRVDG